MRPDVPVDHVSVVGVDGHGVVHVDQGQDDDGDENHKHIFTYLVERVSNDLVGAFIEIRRSIQFTANYK